MKTKTADLAPETVPSLTDAQREHLAALAALPDALIDIHEIPELSDEAWSASVRGRFYRPVKQQITARVDADVLEWLKSHGRGYQGRLNAFFGGKCWLRSSRLAGRSRQTILNAEYGAGGVWCTIGRLRRKRLT